MGDEAMVAEIRSWVQEAQDIAAQHPDEANPIMDALAGLIVRIDAAEAQLEQVQRERDAALYKQEQADKRAALAYKDADAAEAARDAALAEVERLREALSDIFAKANDDHLSSAKAVAWISERCLAALATTPEEPSD